MKKISLLLVFLCLTLCAYDVSAQNHEVVVFAGACERDHCPVLMTLTPENCPGVESFGKSAWKLVRDDEEIPVMLLKRAGENAWDMAFILNDLTPYEKRVYQLVAGSSDSQNSVNIEKDGETLNIEIEDEPFTTYVMSTDEKQPRPIFYPVYGPDGVAMTRGYPMEYHEGERKDHPHHQSLWVAHGLVNGVDNWSVGSGHGYTVQKELLAHFSGPVCGRFETLNDWTANDGKKLLEERRVITIWGMPDSARMIDFDMTFTATEGDVKFGDTKEGGLISIRVAHSIRERQEEGDGGTIANSNGQVGAGEAWGKAAPWCDYSGPVDGITAGFTIMDHPYNPFYPTHYHVRDYGLFTANPFGLSYFIDKKHDGSQVLKKGESWRCRYRIYIHSGTVETGNVAQAYCNYADGPKVSLR